uniref:Putative ovule protein n=1 Tax=Solanum chacoense TaxID=4108 RepID=A0A0V0IBA1_SOLCH
MLHAYTSFICLLGQCFMYICLDIEFFSMQDSKVCLSDDTFPDGFKVRKGVAVAYQPWAMGRMTSLWGDDAEDFRPERWIDENCCFRQESPFKFTAFQVPQNLTIL